MDALPADNRTRILDAAEQLFFSQGYAKTTVQNIIDLAKVSKGGFYHHFVSLEDLVRAISVRAAQRVVDYLQPVLNNKSLGAIEKLETISLQAMQAKAQNLDVMIMLTRVMHDPANIALRFVLEEMTFEMTRPLYVQIIEEGQGAGQFAGLHPEAIAEFILRNGSTIGYQTAQIIMSDSGADIEKLRIYIQTFEMAVGKILGMQRPLRFVDHDLLDDIIQRMRQKLKDPQGGGS